MSLYATWNNKSVFTIRMVGTGEQIKKWLATLTEDFNEPKFGYNGEYWDEQE